MSVKGPAKVKKGKKATYKVKVTNSGNADATGVKVKVKGKGVKAKKKVGKIPAGKSKTVKVKLKPKKPGKVKLTFKVTSKNAGGKTVNKRDQGQEVGLPLAGPFRLRWDQVSASQLTGNLRNRRSQVRILSGALKIWLSDCDRGRST